MQRIAIMGHGGAGKSTLAVQLGQQLNIPVFHTDKLFWDDNRVYKSLEERTLIQDVVLEKDAWIIDGIGPSRMAPARVKAADMVIILDIPRRIRILRWLKRVHKYRGRVRPDMGGNNKEIFDLNYLKFLLTTPDLAKWTEELRRDYPDTPIVYLRTKKEVHAFLSSRSA